MEGSELRDSDLDRLLSPISVEEPAGESLLYEGFYDRIREARREDDPDLKQGVWQHDLKRADWSLVKSLCAEALETRTKDLQLGAWYLEASLHLDGFAGVAEGLALLNALCELFWDSLYPQIDGDVERRLGPIRWINEKLSVELKRIPLTEPESGEATPHSWADWEEASRLENEGRKDPSVLQRAAAAGKPTCAKVQSGAMLTPVAAFQQRLAHLDEALRQCAELQRFLDQSCGDNSPALNKFRDNLLDIRQFTRDILMGREEEVAEALAALSSADGPQEEASPRRTAQRIRSRAEAYRVLSDAADYLLETEPHSPVPYLIRRAIVWGGMSLEELLREVVRNEAERSELFRLLQMPGGR